MWVAFDGVSTRVEDAATVDEVVLAQREAALVFADDRWFGDLDTRMEAFWMEDVAGMVRAGELGASILVFEP